MRRVWIGLLVAVLAAGGCLGRGYARVMEVHVEVVEAMARKLCAMAQAGRAPAPDTMGEFLYPAKRAREVGQYFPSAADRPSFEQFSAMLERYGEMVRVVDAARQTPESWQAAAPGVCAGRDAIVAGAARIRQALREGQ